MGGFGALLLAARLGADRGCRSRGGESRAVAALRGRRARRLRQRNGLRRGSRLGQQDQLDGIAVRIDCREGDPFYENTRDYVNGFDTQPAGGFQLGDHDVGYRRMAPDQLQFLADCLVAA